MKERIKKIITFLEKKGINEAEIGIILGTGLGGLVDEINVNQIVPYDEIEGFPLSTVEFHKGRLIYGTLGPKTIIALEGRFHFYEGYSAAELVIPVRVMKGLGIKHLLVSNAAGNMNRNWTKGELMLFQDHINLLPDNPLRGHDAASFGPIFVDLSQPYDPSMSKKIKQIAETQKTTLREGVYAAVAGPNLETRAEYRYLQTIGADVVGMSTVPEVIAANQLGLPVAAISVLTDDCDPDDLKPVDISEILSIAKEAEKDLILIIKELVALL
jgi:purine-nucleoside phosphorylase